MYHEDRKTIDRLWHSADHLEFLFYVYQKSFLVFIYVAVMKI